MPKTVLGKWSVGFAIALIVIFVVFLMIAASGEKGGDSLSDNLWLAVPGILFVFSGIMAFITSIVAITRKIDRSTLVCVAFVLGFMVTSLVVGEILFPH